MSVISAENWEQPRFFECQASHPRSPQPEYVPTLRVFRTDFLHCLCVLVSLNAHTRVVFLADPQYNFSQGLDRGLFIGQES